jgi:hypothetical protein
MNRGDEVSAPSFFEGPADELDLPAVAKAGFAGCALQPAARASPTSAQVIGFCHPGVSKSRIVILSANRFLIPYTAVMADGLPPR